MVQGCRVFRTAQLSPILLLVEVANPTVDAEVDRLLKVLEVGRSMGSLVLFDAKPARVDDTHEVFLSYYAINPSETNPQRVLDYKLGAIQGKQLSVNSPAFVDFSAGRLSRGRRYI
jgi:hypothetical protein